MPRLSPYAARMRALAAVPAFIFLAIGLTGLVVDLLKIGFGRFRPKLLFDGDSFGFSWLALRADHWSFPSGHTGAIVALMTALWCLWPRHVLFYATIAVIVAFSRVGVGAHYLSDTLMAGLVAVLVTRYLWSVLARCGVDPTAALRGEPIGWNTLSWRERLGLPARRRVSGDPIGSR